jgi:alkylhydroperoxidase family enzyme
MSRVPYRDATVLPPGIPPLNLFRMMAHSPSTLPHLLSLGTAAFRDTSLTPHLRELLCLWNAKRLHCEYQWKQHLPVAKQNSVTETQIAALLAEDISGEEWSLEERALLAFLDQVISMPEVDDGVFLEARNHFSDQVLVEVVTMQVKKKPKPLVIRFPLV